jgi:hypothetical protein
MIKTLLLTLIIVSASYGEVGTYLYTKNTRCIEDLHPNPNANGFCYRYSNNPNRVRCTTRAKLTQFIKGYEYNSNTGECTLERDLKLTGLNKESYSSLMMYLAIAFTLAFFSILFMLIV